jgi:hypothetical protein
MKRIPVIALLSVLAAASISVPVLTSLVRPVHADTERIVHLADLAGNSALAQQIIFSGDGGFSADKATVQARGSFTQFDNSVPAPKPIIAFGTWTATGFTSYTEFGTYGAQASGILVVSINLVTSSGAVIPATLKVVCNVPPGGIFTGSPEGITLTLGGNIFTPVAGVTLINTVGSN